MSTKNKHELRAAVTVLAMLAAGIIGFFTIQPFRMYVEDSYNSIFKVIIADRVLKDESIIHSNIAYCGSSNPRQTLDLYIPYATDGAPHKLIIFIHGGAWSNGDKSTTLLSYYGKDLLKSGVAIAALNYRLYPEVTYPEPNNDVTCALTYLSSHAAQYNISQDSWAVFGDSAGAQLAAYAMSDNRVNKPLTLFIGFYGPYDLSAQIERQPTPDIAAWQYVNKGQDSDAASPLLRPAKVGAKYLLLHGEKDRVVHVSQSEQFYSKLKSEGIDATFTRVKNAGHSFNQRTNPTNKQILRTIISELATE